MFGSNSIVLHFNVDLIALCVQLGLKSIGIGDERVGKSLFTEFNEFTYATSIHGKRFIHCLCGQKGTRQFLLKSCREIKELQ